MSATRVALQPVHYGSPGSRLSGVLATPVDAHSGDRGVLVCAPFGYENIVYYRFLTGLARRVAEQGRPALWFDWPGCGDSDGDEREPDVIERSLDAVGRSAELLRELTGVAAVDGIGLRIGATLMAAAVSAGAAVDDLVLWAPFENGKAYEREMRAFQLITDEGVRPPTPVDPLPGLDSAGFLLSPPAVEALRRIELAELSFDTAASRRILLSVNDSRDGGLAERLAAAGADVTTATLEALENLSPRKGLGAGDNDPVGYVTAWLREGKSLARPPIAEIPQTTAITEGVAETAVVLGESPRLVAIETTPDRSSAADSWIVFFTVGPSTRRMGPTRLWTRFARAWAERGASSLRVEVRGTGDSDGPELDTVESLYDPGVLDDARTAVTYLETTREAARITAIGLCAGGYMGFHAALQDDRIDKVIVINPITLRWTPEDATLNTGAQVRASLTRPDRWARVLRGEAAVGRAAATITRAALVGTRLALTRGLRRSVGPWDTKTLILEGIRDLSARGCEVTFVLSVGDTATAYLARYLGGGYADVLREAGASVEFIQGADHTFRQLWSHEPLQETLERHLEGVLA